MGSYFPRIAGAMCLSISVSLYLFATILNKEFVMVAYAFQGLGMGIFGTANTSYISSISKAFILPTLLSIITFLLTISLKDEKYI